MRIVIDLQAAQSAHSAHRGIGRYSLALAKAMLRQRRDHEILIALNGMFEGSVERIRATFDGLIPQDDIRVWHASVPAMPVAGAPLPQRRAAEGVRDAFLASLRPDVVHLASLFESNAEAVTAVHPQPGGTLTAVTLYDLIPLVQADLYLDSDAKRADYQEKLDSLKRADLLLAISEWSRHEALDHLGLPASRVVTISSDADPHFTPAAVPPEREAALRTRLGVGRPFAMYTGGIDPRKNVEGLIRAWSSLPTPVRESHQLAIVCAVKTPERLRLERLMDDCGLAQGDVVLTGFVADEDLIDLYRLCRLFVFPSRHEGFGLPALEAMRCGAPVIGGNNSSIAEVIGLPEAMFDAHSDGDLAARMLQGLQDEEFRDHLLRHGAVQATRFDWDESARRAIAAMEQLVAQAPAPATNPPQARSRRKPRLALVGPLPPQRSGIADASASLLPELGRHYDVDIVTQQDEVAVPSSHYRAQRTAEWFDAHAARYDRILYQLGNSTFHEFEFALMRRHPGVVVLHDFFLSGVLAQHELDHPDDPAWSHALYRSHGWHALADRLQGGDLVRIIYGCPSNFEVLAGAKGVIVHSEHALDMAARWYGRVFASRWACVPLSREPARPVPKAQARQRLGIAPEAFIVGSFGHMGRTKLNLELVRAWKACAAAAGPDAQLVFVGEADPHDYGEAVAVEMASMPGRVRITGWTDAAQYALWLSACDVAVQLRTASRGETSAAVLDAMNHGLPCIANREGSMAHLDPEAVSLLPAVFTVEELASRLDTLWRDAALRRAMGDRACAIVHGDHSPTHCAAAYASAIEAFAAPLSTSLAAIAESIGRPLPLDTPADCIAGWARAITQNQPEPRPSRQLVIALAQGETLPAFAAPLLAHTPVGWRVEVVTQDATGLWRYARSSMLQQLGAKPALQLQDDPLDLQPGDCWTSISTATSKAPPRVRELALPQLQWQDAVVASLAWSVVRHLGSRQGARRWFIDISELVVRDWGSGIQRVVKNHLLELMAHPPEGAQVVPVYADSVSPGYRIAWQFMGRLAGVRASGLRDDPPIDARAGDLFFGLDLQPHVVPRQRDAIAALSALGVRVGFMVYDLLPIRLADCFHPGGAGELAEWLRAVSSTADFTVSISQSTSSDMERWLDEQGLRVPPHRAAVHLGSDLAHSLPTQGVPPESAQQLASLRSRPTFLMVGTLEPRKGHAAVLDAFEALWARGVDAGLVIAGHTGWMVEDLVARLRAHPELGTRLLWTDSASDEFLAHLYDACVALIAASKGEGFGLPIVEAARRGIPVIARDLPVFREVAGDHAFYFTDDVSLPDMLADWLALRERGAQPDSQGMPLLTWAQSAGRLKDVLLARERD